MTVTEHSQEDGDHTVVLSQRTEMMRRRRIGLTRKHNGQGQVLGARGRKECNLCDRSLPMRACERMMEKDVRKVAIRICIFFC